MSYVELKPTGGDWSTNRSAWKKQSTKDPEQPDYKSTYPKMTDTLTPIDSPPTPPYTQESPNEVNPSYYNTAEEFQLKDIQKMFVKGKQLDAYEGSVLLTILKYLYRFKEKNTVESNLSKAQWYLKELADYHGVKI